MRRNPIGTTALFALLSLVFAGCGGGGGDGDDAGQDAPVDLPVDSAGDAAADDAGVGDGGETLSDVERAEDAAPPETVDADAPSDTADAGEEEEAWTFRFRALNHVLSTGQSLSVGSAGAPPLSTTQPYRNKMFNTGVLAGGTNLTHFVPLVEATVETMSSGMANLATKLAREEVFSGYPPPEDSHEVLVSCHGIGGTAYAGLKKGTAAFANGMAQATAAKTLCDFLGLTYSVRAVTTVHGESDHVGGNTHYAADLAEWQSDYETDVTAITGQLDPIPLLQTQMSSWTKYGQRTSLIPAAQLAASVAAPDKVVLVGPKYFLAYAPDGVHLSNAGYRHMGEYYAKVYEHVVLMGETWEPLRPLDATISGAVITVTFHVPFPPLVLDTTLVTNPGSHGFEYADDSAGAPAIASVTLEGATTVKVTLASAPTGGARKLRYAWTGTAGALAGAATGARGNLRDSDPTVSLSGAKLYNWAVHFSIDVH